MATKYSIRICFEHEDSESVALLADAIPHECIIDFVDSLWANAIDWQKGESNLRWVDCIDMDTGEVVYERTDWDDDEPDDWYREMGFDPYEGCYTYDC